MKQSIPLLLVSAGGVIMTLGDIVLKKRVQNSNIYIFLLGIAVYLIGIVFLALSFQYQNIAVASVMFVIFNVISLSFVSRYFFQERLSLLQIIGISLGILSVICLELS